MNSLLTLHYNMMASLAEISLDILDMPLTGDLERLSTLVDNRDRALSNIKLVQVKIENLPQKFKKELIYINWCQDVSEWSLSIQNFDKLILEKLNNEKSQTQQEISTVFMNREKLKKYSISKVI